MEYVAIMGKRSNFKRRERDDYATPYAAVVPLLPHLSEATLYDEPCCGDGDLVSHLGRHGHRCLKARDIKFGTNALEIQHSDADIFITNPPWSRDILHPLIDHLTLLLSAWLLIDADWAYTKQAAHYLDRCEKIVSIGRIKWIPGSKNTGKDNSAWYFFRRHRPGQDEYPPDGLTRFYRRSLG
jgi:hypothetical protein